MSLYRYYGSKQGESNHSVEEEDSDPLLSSQMKQRSVTRIRVSEPADVHGVELTAYSQEDKDSDRLFLLSFAQELSKLPSHIKMWARAEIANVMQQAVSSNYTNTMPGAGFDAHGPADLKRRNLADHII